MFHYKVKTPEGATTEGYRDAPDKFVLARKLREEGNTVLSIKEEEKGRFQKNLDSLMSLLNRVGLKEKIMFTNNMRTMIEAGMSLSRSLEILKKQTKNPRLKSIITSLLNDINKGKPFSESLERFPDTFPNYFVAMIRAGEESGQLPRALEVTRDQLTKSYELKRKIRGAMIYPAIVITLIVAITILMMIFVVPTLSKTFADLDAELPATTQFILGLSGFIESYILFLIVGAALILAGFLKWAKTKQGKRVLGWLFLHLPVARNITIEANSALTMRTLSSLISSGVSMIRSLEITSEVLQNPYYKDVLGKAGESVQKGETLSTTFQGNEHLYPVLMAEMIEVGEETGQLAKMLERGAVFYEGEVDTVTKNLSTIIEPVLMVIIGIAVGFFAVAMIQPMYSLGDFI